jgi:hypothetical protein
MGFEFLQSNTWRLITFGITITFGFAFIINRTRREPDAQTSNRQAAGWVMILGSLAIAIGLNIWVFVSFGGLAGVASIVLSLIAAGILVILSCRD